MKIIVSNIKSKLVTDDLKLKSLLYQKYSVKKKGYQYSKAYKAYGWDGMVRFFNEDGTFGTGLLEDIIVDLEKVGAEYEIEDLRDSSDISVEPYLDSIKLRDYQQVLLNKILNRKRGVCKSPTGCHRKGQGILMYDGTIKKVEDIEVGDQLMGPDSKPRNVLELYRGKENMVEIKPISGGNPFVVNESHILSLFRTNDGTKLANTHTNISIKDYYKTNKTFKHTHKLWKPSNIDFSSSSSLKLDPYFIGIMLGDGSHDKSICITTEDKEIETYFTDYCLSFPNIHIHEQQREGNNSKIFSASLLNWRVKPKQLNPIGKLMGEIGLKGVICENKFIPHVYKTASREDRLQLLAGLMDTDGHLHHKGFDYVSKSKHLVEDISFVARSVGLKVSPIVKKIIPKICDTIYYRIYISGNTEIIPCKLLRKQSSSRKQIKNHLVTGFKIVDLCKEEDYFGFELDGDHLYLLDDFTVTHNSGKTWVMAALASALQDNFGVFIFNKKSLVVQTYELFQEIGIDCGICYGEAEIWRPIMLCTIQSIDKLYDQYKDLAKFIIFDEVHEMCSGKFSKKVIKAFPEAYYRWGFTATPPKDPEKALTLKSAFGNIIQEVTAKDLIDGDKLAKPNIYMIKADQVDEVDGEEITEYEDYTEEYEKFIINCDTRNQKIADLANVLVEAGRKVLIVVKSLEHAATLEDLIPGSVKLEGKDDMTIRKQEIEIFRKAKEGVCVIGTVIFQTGVDVPEITDVINARGLKSEIATLQLLGRGMRLSHEKTEFNFYDFYDNGKYLSKHSNERVKAYIREGHKVEKLK